MPVEILIYVYLGICAGMILFNIATALLSRRREHRSFRDGIRLELTVSRELDRLAETGAVSERKSALHGAQTAPRERHGGL